MKRNKNKKGFTIVELVIVIGVIGILSAILIPTFVSLTSKAETAALKSNLSNAYSMYAAVAADRKYEVAEGASAEKTIEFKGQKELVLKSSDTTPKYYVFNEEWEELTTAPTSPTYVVASDEANSKFGGFTFILRA